MRHDPVLLLVCAAEAAERAGERSTCPFEQARHFNEADALFDRIPGTVPSSSAGAVALLARIAWEIDIADLPVCNAMLPGVLTRLRGVFAAGLQSGDLPGLRIYLDSIAAAGAVEGAGNAVACARSIGAWALRPRALEKAGGSRAA